MLLKVSHLHFKVLVFGFYLAPHSFKMYGGSLGNCHQDTAVFGQLIMLGPMIVINTSLIPLGLLEQAPFQKWVISLWLELKYSVKILSKPASVKRSQALACRWYRTFLKEEMNSASMRVAPALRCGSPVLGELSQSVVPHHLLYNFICFSSSTTVTSHAVQLLPWAKLQSQMNGKVWHPQKKQLGLWVCPFGPNHQLRTVI